MADFQTIECLEGAVYTPKNILVTGGAGTFQHSTSERAPRAHDGWATKFHNRHVEVLASLVVIVGWPGSPMQMQL